LDPLRTGNKSPLRVAWQPHQSALLQLHNVQFGVQLPGTLEHQNQNIQIWANMQPNLVTCGQRNNIGIQVTCTRLQLPNRTTSRSTRSRQQISGFSNNPGQSG